MSTANVTKASEFLRALYGEWEHGYLVLWRSDDSASMCLAADELDSADKWVERNRKGKDAHSYYGMGLQPRRLPKTQRGEAGSTIAIPGIWCDLDFAETAGAKKSKKKYPPRELAEQCLSALPLMPSVVVLTGGGMHPYWLFHDLLYFDDSTRAKAASLVLGWHRLIAEHLRRLGSYDLDPTADLARVMRLPGSWNFRAGQNVVLGEGYCDPDQWRRYEPADFEPYLVAEDPKVQRVEYKVGELILSADRTPILETFQALEFNSPEFKRVWNHRKELASSSEYELSIATYAVMALWSDQQIADLIISHRRKYEPQKLDKVLRRDYIENTIAKARGDNGRDEALRSLNGDAGASHPDAPEVADAAPVGTDAPSETEGQKILGSLSSAFGVKVEAWVQFGREKPIYSLVLSGGIEVKIGGVAAVVESDKAFRQAIYAQTGHVVPPVGRARWPGVVEALAKIVTVHEAEDATDVASVRAGVEAYVRTADRYQASQRDLSCDEGKTVIEDGWIYIYFEHFRKWLNFRSGDRWDKPTLLNAMRLSGFERHKLTYNRGPERSSKSYWRVRADQFPMAIEPTVSNAE